MTKIAEIEIEFCNSSCPYFYHRYDDGDNVWCGHEKLNKRIFSFEESVLLFGDSKHRAIPEECPLEDV